MEQDKDLQKVVQESGYVRQHQRRTTKSENSALKMKQFLNLAILPQFHLPSFLTGLNQLSAAIIILNIRNLVNNNEMLTYI